MATDAVWTRDAKALLLLRSSYYNADTADLEIGQEFEDAEAEEEAAMELQRASYKRLDPADYGEEEEEVEERREGTEARGKEKGKGKTGKRGGVTAQGAALLAMKSDLEQIALGEGGEVTKILDRLCWPHSRGFRLRLVALLYFILLRGIDFAW